GDFARPRNRSAPSNRTSGGSLNRFASGAGHEGFMKGVAERGHRGMAFGLRSPAAPARGGPRVTSGRSPSLDAPEPGMRPRGDALEFHLSSQWVWMAPCMGVSLLLMALVSWTLPSLLSGAIALTGIALVCAAPVLARIERERCARGWR